MLSCFGHVWLFATLWTVALQAPLSMGFSRQEYWTGLPCPPSGDLPNPGIEPVSLLSPPSAGRFFTTSTSWETHPIFRRLFMKVKLLSKYLSGGTDGKWTILNSRWNGKCNQCFRFSCSLPQGKNVSHWKLTHSPCFGQQKSEIMIRSLESFSLHHHYILLSFSRWRLRSMV